MANRVGGRRFGVVIAVVLAAGLLVMAVQVSMAQQEQPGLGLLGRITQDQVSPAVTVPPVEGGPGFSSVSWVEFRPLRSIFQYGYSNGLYNSGSSVAEFAAPVDLPHGATVTRFVLYFYNNSAYGIPGSLYRTELAVGPGEYPPMAHVTGTERKDAVQFAIDLTVDDPVVDRQSYAYWIYVQLAPTNSVGLIGARVDYSFDAYLPMAVKP